MGSQSRPPDSAKHARQSGDVEGFKNCLEKVCGTIYPKDGKIIWLNMRQEPNVYVNGTPICARPPNKIGEYAELGAVTTAALTADEPEFMRVVEGRMKENADTDG